VFPNSSRLSSHRMLRRLSFSLASTLLAGLTLTCLSSWLAVASAQAASTATCPSVPLSQPFLKWGDEGFYTLVPGGHFEKSPSEWTLSGGANLAAGGEPYGVTGTVGAYSLALPAGASAQSPFVCVEPSDRTYRFFTRSEGTEASVLVQVVYETSKGNVASAGKTLALKGSWEPSAILHTGAALATAITGETAHLALRFTGVSGTSRIDDVFIDPRMR
jgi:hypothetical protein